MSLKCLDIRHLGMVPYAEAVSLQKALVEARREPGANDTLLLLEHPPVITLGVRTRGARDHVVASADELRLRGVEVFDSGRGGDVTYHGPGQLVAYPIIDLRPDRCDVHRYVRDLEETLIRVAGDFGVTAERVPGLTGVWVGREKLAAIGVRISRWITSHGIAFNVTTDLDGFSLIVPCGLAGRGVTSLARLVGRDVPLADVAASFVRRFCEVFERAPVFGSELKAHQ